jgi:uncharacterized damage-inducible protein DinB
VFYAPERPDLLFRGEERPALDSWLEFCRGTLLYKCDGLDLEQLKLRPVTGSSLSLLGIIRHMTYVEQVWFERIFAGREVAEYYKLAGDRDADFNNLDDVGLDEVLANFADAVATSRHCAFGHDLSEPSIKVSRGRFTDLRWIYVHMIEEYSRHNGHADLLRELIDGTTGY